MFLFFVTEPDVAGKEGEPLLASAGRTPDECWTSLSINRQRMLAASSAESPAALKEQFTASGHAVHKYEVTPL